MLHCQNCEAEVDLDSYCPGCGTFYVAINPKVGKYNDGYQEEVLYGTDKKAQLTTYHHNEHTDEWQEVGVQFYPSFEEGLRQNPHLKTEE